MATRKKADPNDEILPPQETPQEPDFTPEDVAIMDLIEELGGDTNTRIRIYRQGKTHTDLTLINECSPGEFDPMLLAHPPYNGGEFRLHARSKSGIVFNRLLKVAPAADAILPGAAIAHPAQNQDMTGVIREMMAGFQNTMMQAITAMKPVESDPMRSLQGLKELAAIVTPAPVAPVAAPDTFGSTMKALDMLLSLKDKLAPAAPITDNDGEISLPGVLAMAVREFKATRESGNAAMQPALPAPPPLNAEPAELTDQQREAIDMNILLNAQLRMANRAAAKNSDAGEYAENIYGLIPEDVLQMIATDPQWFAELVKVAPECAKYPAWYAAIGEKIKALMVEDGLLTLPVASVDTPANGDINAGTGNAG